MATDEMENSGQPVWKSVILFACKGMIEGIIVLLFLWLLVQVLFTKQLEVHLQILLSVGLTVLCCSLILGCVICWYKTRLKPHDKNTVRTTLPSAPMDNVTVVLSPSPSSATTFTKLQYEDLEGGVSDYPSAFESSTPSDEEFTAVSEVNKQISCFQMRRLSSPTVSSSLYKPGGLSSLPSFPKLNLLAKTRKVLEHHCTVAGDSYLFSEHRRLTVPNPHSPCTLSPLQTQGLLQEESLFPNYGSNSCNETSDSFLHFTLIFSSTQNTLTISLVGITGVVRCLEEVSVQLRLPPLCHGPLDIPAQEYNLSSGLYKKKLTVNVGSLEELKSCILWLAIFKQDNAKTSLFEELEVCCSSLDWTPDKPVDCIRELRKKIVDKTKKVTS